MCPIQFVVAILLQQPRVRFLDTELVDLVEAGKVDVQAEKVLRGGLMGLKWELEGLNAIDLTGKFVWDHFSFRCWYWSLVGPINCVRCIYL